MPTTLDEIVAEAKAGKATGALPVAFAVLSMGGHLLVGMEDNVVLARGRPVSGDTALVERAAGLAAVAQRPALNAKQARALLGITERLT